jgi:hypothetical protein
MQAVFLHDALVTLGLEREVLATTLRPCLQSAITDLKPGSGYRLRGPASWLTACRVVLPDRM